LEHGNIIGGVYGVWPIYPAFVGLESVQIDPVMLWREAVQGAIPRIGLEIQEY
jgi:hypothetical protein